MSKKKMYWLLSFILFTFTLLAVVIVYEVNEYKKGTVNVFDDDNNLIDPDLNGEESKDELNTDTIDSSDNEEIKNEDLNDDDSDINQDITKDEENKEITMVFTGDIYLSNYVTSAYDKEGIDGIVSKEVLDELSNADVTMVNQEFAFSNRGTAAPDKQFTFRLSPAYISTFLEMGIDIATLANNHTLDFGRDALLDSITTLRENNIAYVGAGEDITRARETKYMDVKGKNIAFLAASRVIPVTDWNATSSNPGLFTTYDPTALIEEIKIAKVKSDFIVVYVHWGLERKSHPEEYQRKLAQQYINAGADIVVGSHPHVLQGVEYYNGKPIIYSLGNFIFNNNIEQTAILKVVLTEDNEVKVYLLPCKAVNAKTSFMDKSLYDSFYSYMENISFGVTFYEGEAIIN
jgi:poly-gamma-glutamate capsule biosynthesis protein CapA/YwtB (metallophosphatase superfamily)